MTGARNRTNAFIVVYYSNAQMLTPLPFASPPDPKADAGFAAAAARLGAPLTPRQVAQFRHLAELLVDANTRVNLTAITAYDAILARHFLDSLSPLAALPSPRSGRKLRVIDVGSGAGFPGLPLALVRDDFSVVLADSVGKKTAFIAAAIAALGITNATVVTARAEDIARRPGCREAFDIAIARAVAPLPVLLEYLLPLCRLKGMAVALKKGNLAAELAAAERAAHVLGGGRMRPLPVSIPGIDDDGRVVVVVPKARPSPAAYPRRAGLPARQPL